MQTTTVAKAVIPSTVVRSAARAKREEAAIRKLIVWAGSQAALADAAGVSRVAVNRWIAAGQVGKESALTLSLMKNCPVTLADMREDLKGYEFPKGTVKASKERAAEGYRKLRERHAAVAAAAKAAKAARG